MTIETSREKDTNIVMQNATHKGIQDKDAHMTTRDKHIRMTIRNTRPRHTNNIKQT